MNYAAALKSTRMKAVITAVDDAVNLKAGVIELWNGPSDTLLATVTLNVPSFTESGGVITMSGTPKTATAVADGRAALALIKNGDGTLVVDQLSVGIYATNIILDTMTIVTGQTVTLSRGTITHP